MPTAPILILSPASGTFPFQTKNIVLASGTKTVLGSTEGSATGGSSRVATGSNGWFPPRQTEDNAISSVSPLPLSSTHAEVWCDDGKVYIRDLDSPFGTFVNSTRVLKETALKAGDTIGLGSRISRNDKTPAYITDFHLCPVIATVSLKT